MGPVAGGEAVMSRARKYEVGQRIETIGELWETIRRQEYVMVRGRPTHPGWISSWQLNMAATSVAGGVICRAQITKEWAEKHKALQEAA